MASPHDPIATAVRVLPDAFTTRRATLVGLGGFAAAALLPTGPAMAASVPVARRLAFTNLHTGESCMLTFQEKGVYDPAALDEIAHVLRDHRTGEVAAIDPKLLTLLADLRRAVDSAEPFQVYSGYRSPKTNAMLAAKSGGVAKKSFHMRAMAVDCFLPDVPLDRLHKAALVARRGGVGRYNNPGFLHIDVGPVRRW
ncbi:DUF882 domain-containing protein [Marivibrio halodurans]|uniref:Murein endopeptidase K n=1 Tax=Marivibrio halodurans TaxID=2039722 RepID=A0A8J7V2Y7_9PROT|nr:DUF882 domain-containing protein [Marivibrio halodurans]MBP5857835.1 DUF882 domain-containing protein [Marivibrio halodurans]